MRDVESPGEQIGKRRPRDLRRRARAVATEHCDPDGAGVEPFRVRADDGLVDTAVPAFEDLPVLVDEKVVADVVPAVALHVVDLDPPHDRRGLRSGVGVRAGGVVHERELHARRIARRRAPDCLVRTPDLAREHQAASRPSRPAAAGSAPQGYERSTRGDGRHGRAACTGSHRPHRSSRDCRCASRPPRAPPPFRRSGGPPLRDRHAATRSTSRPSDLVRN